MKWFPDERKGYFVATVTWNFYRYLKDKFNLQSLIWPLANLANTDWNMFVSFIQRFFYSFSIYIEQSLYVLDVRSCHPPPFQFPFPSSNVLSSSSSPEMALYLRPGSIVHIVYHCKVIVPPKSTFTIIPYLRCFIHFMSHRVLNNYHQFATNLCYIVIFIFDSFHLKVSFINLIFVNN